MSELEVMLSSMSEEQKQRIMDKAERLEAYFKDDVLYMKDKDEEWSEGMLPKGDGFIMNEKTTKEVNNEKY